jgi:hypothetical protein
MEGFVLSFGSHELGLVKRSVISVKTKTEKNHSISADNAEHFSAYGSRDLG